MDPNNSIAVIVLEPEESCETAGKWLTWLGAMIFFVCMLIYFVGLNMQKNERCEFDNTYDVGRPHEHDVKTY